MRSRTATASAALLLAAAVGAGVAPAGAATGQGGEQSEGAGLGKAMRATGAFTVAGVESFTWEPMKGGKCRFEVTGTLDFDGALDGTATGTTVAKVFAPCDEAAPPTAPGTHFDVFRFRGQFTGDVLGVPTEARLTYAGVTRPGGKIKARIKLRGGAWAVLRTRDAVVLEGGTYRGRAKVRPVS